MLVSNKLLVLDMTPLVARDDAVRHCKLLDTLSQFHSRETQQGFASGGRGECETFRVKIRRSRLTSRRGSLIWTDRCIALYKRDATNWDAQLLRDQLVLSCKNSLTEIAFACICCDHPIGANG